MRRRGEYVLLSATVAALLFFVFSLYAGDPSFQKFTFKNGALSAATAIAFDKSVVFEYGKPIRVVHVVDGDTIQLINGEYVRYIGMDTPEEVDPRKPVQCFAKEAAAENTRLTDGQDVTIYKDVSDRDKYGRLIGFVYLSDGTFVNATLVKEGFAFAYPYKPDISKSAEFKAEQTAAKTAGLGLWSACVVRTLSGGREQTNDL